MSNEWLIWSNEHNAWWRNNRCGYTSSYEQAGLYTFEEALRICRDANYGCSGNTDDRYGRPDETMLRKDCYGKGSHDGIQT